MSLVVTAVPEPAPDAPHLPLDSARSGADLLAQAARLFASTGLDYEAVLTAVTRLLAGSLGDHCTLLLLSRDAQSLEPVAYAHVKMANREQAEHLLSGMRLPLDGTLSGSVIRSGDTLFLPRVSHEEVQQVTGSPFASHINFLRVHSLICVPLRGWGETIGVLALGRDATALPYTQHDVALLQDLAGLAGLFIESARRYEAERRQRALLEAVVNALPVGVVIAEAPTGQIVLGNAEVERIFRHPVHPAATIDDYREWMGFHPDGRPYQPEDWPLARVLRTGQAVVQQELRIQRGDGTTGYVRLSAVPVCDQAGQMIAAVVVDQDVTEQVEARERVDDLVGQRDQFISMAAHELRSPLTSLVGFLQLSRRHLRHLTDQITGPAVAEASGVGSGTGGAGPTVQATDAASAPAAESTLNAVTRTLSYAEEQASRLRGLVDRLLDLSRIQAGKLALTPVPADLVELVRHAVQAAQARTEQHPIHLTAPDSLPLALDPLRFEQVLTNLLDNAIRYSPTGGTIEVTLTLDSDTEPAIAVVSIRDHGLGIPPAALPHIFEPYRQAHGEGHAGGMGIGLYVCRQVVERHGGTIHAELPDDGGSRFIVRLPCVPPTPA